MPFERGHRRVDADRDERRQRRQQHDRLRPRDDARGGVVGRARGQIGRGAQGQLGAERPQHGVADVPVGRDHPGDAARPGVRPHRGLELGRRALGRRHHERVVLADERHPRHRGQVGEVDAELGAEVGVEHVPREVDVRDAPGVGQRPVDVEAVHVAAGDEDLAQPPGRAPLLVQRALRGSPASARPARRACRRAAAAAAADRAARAGRWHAIDGACALRPHGVLAAAAIAGPGHATAIGRDAARS